MKPHVYLKLGRVSNLPTVWTNVFAGIALSGGTASPTAVTVLVLAASSAYVGGMFLNDAFDRNIDARERPERPIPSGEATAGEVFAIGFGLLSVCVLLVAWFAFTLAPEPRPAAVVAASALVALILLYDTWHKKNPLSAVIMGLCRGAVYVTAALASGGAFTSPLIIGALSLVGYVVGLTLVARKETQQRFEGRAALVLVAMPAGVALCAFSAAWAAWAALALFWVGSSSRSARCSRTAEISSCPAPSRE